MAEDIKKTLGGDRLGSGNKNQLSLHNYERSTQNLSKQWKSSIAPGVLYPCYCNVALNGDTFDIDLNAGCRTIPTQGPLFDTFKLQIDFFLCPMRLYVGMLHNNPINLGMKMQEVKLPMLKVIHDKTGQQEEYADEYFMRSQVSSNSLLKYLGLSGIGTLGGNATTHTREINAVPALAYYDIFKNYYANKQEDNAYVITKSSTGNVQTASLNKVRVKDLAGNETIYTIPLASGTSISIMQGYKMRFYGKGLTGANIKLSITGTSHTLTEWCDLGYFTRTRGGDIMDAVVTYKGTTAITSISTQYVFTPKDDIALMEFPLENIDKMRENLLTYHTLGAPYYIDKNSLLPYKLLCDKEAGAGRSLNAYSMNGLCVKTYQSDMFNNWIQTEWIDGNNGIAAVTAIDTSGGEFTLDTLAMAHKVYNMLNRIAISGGTYQDWQEAVYAEKAIRNAETPIYLGGMSSEVVFEEVIANSASFNPDNEQVQALGTLGGRGRLSGKNGGQIHVRVEEPSFIIGIVSLTPRVTYTQGNKWYLTELHDMQDLHAPALDGIGFQDLIVEQMAWWDTVIDPNGVTLLRHSAGKIPAWMNYQTDVNEAFGDFAAVNGKNFMVLDRNYERDSDGGGVKDVTTYIDPSKFNYAFAYNELAAQNFWLQINMNIEARRKMSAKQIPNL